MKVLPMALLGVMLTFVSMASASPAGTPTPSQKATPVSLAPRRNGYSDLPSDASTYNLQQPSNRIPDYVMASDPFAGDNAIIYTRDEIYTAMQQGYEVLQRTRDPSPGPSVAYGNVMYPLETDFEDIGLPDTYWGQFGDGGEADIGHVYMWPLIWTNSWTGFNQNPGDDRVLFNENGIYVGVITRRPSRLSQLGNYRWTPPVDGYGRWIARTVRGPAGWNYPGVPPDGEAGYERPTNWNIASSQRNSWWAVNPGGMAPVGSIGVQVNSSNPPAVEFNPLNATVDPNNPLQFPPMDNSTGVWQRYVPEEGAANSTANEFSSSSDCVFAMLHGVPTYSQVCQSQWQKGSSILWYRITVSGTGQDTNGRCKLVMDNIRAKCGRNGNPTSYYSCNQKYPATVTWSISTNPKDAGYNQFYYGIDMHFVMFWPWSESDSDHQCVADAVEASSCGLQTTNGKWCRNTYWVPNTPLLEWSNDLGPA